MENVKLLFGWIEAGGGGGEWRGIHSLARRLSFNPLRASLPPLPPQPPAPPCLRLPAPEHICRELYLQTASGNELMDGDRQAGAAGVHVCVCACVCV